MEDMDMSSDFVSKRDKKKTGKYRSEERDEVTEEPPKKIPNLVFLGFALASMAVTAALTARNKRVMGNFIGLWVPTILTYSLYNKFVKPEVRNLRNTLH